MHSDTYCMFLCVTICHTQQQLIVGSGCILEVGLVSSLVSDRTRTRQKEVRPVACRERAFTEVSGGTCRRETRGQILLLSPGAKGLSCPFFHYCLH